MLARIAADARHRFALWLIAIVIAVWAFSRATRFREGAPFVLWGDASIVFDKSLEILKTARYPASIALGNFNEIFPYPPPAVLIFSALASLGVPAFMGIWTFLYCRLRVGGVDIRKSDSDLPGRAGGRVSFVAGAAAFSPWLEPYHAVGMIPAFVLCVLVMFDETAPKRARIIVAAVYGAVLGDQGRRNAVSNP